MDNDRWRAFFDLLRQIVAAGENKFWWANRDEVLQQAAANNATEALDEFTMWLKEEDDEPDEDDALAG
jgi:hypothetical protein